MMKKSTISVAALAAALFLLAGCASAVATPATGSVLKGYLDRRAGDAEGALEAYRQALAEDPESAAIRGEISELLVGLSRVPEALEVLDEGLALRPGHPDLLFRRARVLFLSGRREEARADALAAARAGRGSEAFSLAVRLYLASEENQTALDVADEWVKSLPEDADAHFQRGLALVLLGRVPEAKEAFERVIALRPGHIEALEALGGIALDAGRLEEARGYFERVIAANPHELGVSLSLVELDADAGNVDQALKRLRESERWGGGVKERLRMGLLYFRLESLEDAERVFTGLEKSNPGDNVFLLLGSVRLARERYDSAIDAFGRVPVGSDFYDEAMLRKGLALHETGREDEALALLRWLHQEKPEDLGRLEGYATFLKETGKKREALELLENRMAEDDPRTPDLYYLAGVLHDELGEPERAISYMRRVLEVDSENGQAMNYIGYTYALLETNLDEAESLVRRALEILPGNGAVTDSLGWIFFQQKRYEEARAELERAVEILPHDPVIREHLGDAYRALGEKELARKSYEEALHLSPESETLPAKLEEVK